MRNFLDAKLMAKSLREGLRQRNISLAHSDCLELVAQQFGFAEWNMLAARLGDIQPDHSRLVLPKNWFVTGPAINGNTHRMGLDQNTPGAALIESIVRSGEGIDLDGKIAVLMQSIVAESFRGERIRLVAELKTEDADCGTIWLRVDSAGKQGVRFDNMLDRESDGPLKATQDWSSRTIVLDVPHDAESIHYGFFLKGYGKVWARSFDLSTVDTDIATTAVNSQYLRRPSNLDFRR